MPDRNPRRDVRQHLWPVEDKGAEKLERLIAAAETRRKGPAPAGRIASALRRRLRALPPEAWIIALVLAATYVGGAIALVSLLG